MLRPHIFPAFARLLLSFLFVPGALLAQDLPKLSSPDQDQSQPSEDQPISSVKVNVNVVQLFFNVKDDFQVSEDGKPQTIKYFAAESNLPLTLGILIDASGSQQRVLDMEKEVGGDFLSQILREKDLAFVISFDVNVDLLQDFRAGAVFYDSPRNIALRCHLPRRPRRTGAAGWTQSHDYSYRRRRSGQPVEDPGRG